MGVIEGLGNGRRIVIEVRRINKLQVNADLFVWLSVLQGIGDTDIRVAHGGILPRDRNTERWAVAVNVLHKRLKRNWGAVLRGVGHIQPQSAGGNLSQVL